MTIADSHIHHHTMMAAQRSSQAGDKCRHSKEGLHADTESGCQVIKAANEGYPKVMRRFVITEKAPTRALIEDVSRCEIGMPMQLS